MSVRAPQPRLAHARLVGERALIRPLAEADAEAALPLIQAREEVLRWLVWEGPEDVDELRSSYSSWRRLGDDGDDYLFAVCERESERFVGSIGPRFRGHPGLGDLGYWLGEVAWGRGLMSEAVQLVTHLCFRHLAADVLYGYVFVGNQASRRVLEKAGYVHEYTARGKAIKRGRPMDEWYLALSRGAWLRANADYAPRVEEVELDDAQA